MAATNHEQQAWLFASFSKSQLLHRYDRWRKTAQLLHLSQAARHRLEWMIFYDENQRDVSFTCRHVGIARKTLYKWLKRFDQQFLHGLEETSRSGKIENIQTDNGSEFHKYFDVACTQLKLDHYWSRVKTPKDNAVNERFNRTLQEEFIQLGHMTTDTTVFNRQLTEWLIEYNFRRLHQTLDYMPPMNFHCKYHKVLPMYPSSTHC